MNAQELKEKRRVILLNLATDSSLEARLDHIEAALNALDALDNAYITTLEAINERQAQTIAMLKRAPSLFHDVMTISPEYVKRFKGTPTSQGVFLAFNREHKEFLDACDDVLMDNIQPKLLTLSDLKSPDSLNYYRTNVAHEAADVLVTIGGVLAYLGIEWADFEQACRATIEKLNARTDESYAWHEGTETVMHKSKIEALVGKRES